MYDTHRISDSNKTAYKLSTMSGSEDNAFILKPPRQLERLRKYAKRKHLTPKANKRYLRCFFKFLSKIESPWTIPNERFTPFLGHLCFAMSLQTDSCSAVIQRIIPVLCLLCRDSKTLLLETISHGIIEIVVSQILKDPFTFRIGTSINNCVQLLFTQIHCERLTKSRIQEIPNYDLLLRRTDILDLEKSGFDLAHYKNEEFFVTENLFCFKCFKEEKAEKFQICGRCKCAIYCCRQCQKSDYKLHKKICRNRLFYFQNS